LASEIEGQLRDAFDEQYRAGELTQASLAKKLGINRSAVHHRLTGRTNMRIDTIADMVWALGREIKVSISDPSKSVRNDGLGLRNIAKDASTVQRKDEQYLPNVAQRRAAQLGGQEVVTRKSAIEVAGAGSSQSSYQGHFE
jgi:transcriptional regulator with XRE-family HTH domain